MPPTDVPKLDMKAVVGPTLACQSHMAAEVHWKLMLLHYGGTEHVDAVLRLREALSSRWLLLSGLCIMAHCHRVALPLCSGQHLHTPLRPGQGKQAPDFGGSAACGKSLLVFAAKSRLMGMCWGWSALLCRMRGRQASA